jgi:hypothetical protein
MSLRLSLFVVTAALLLTSQGFADTPSDTKPPRRDQLHADAPASPVGSKIAPGKLPGTQTINATAGSQQSLNPQPLPPKWGVTNPGAVSSLNPQPLPPKVGTSNPGAALSLNPQPLPPKVGTAGAEAAQLP